MARSRWISLAALVLAVGFAACNGGLSATRAAVPEPADAATPPVPPPNAPAPALRTSPAVQSQIDRGIAVFAQHCAACHGSRGEGTRDAPPLIGADSLPLDPPPGARLRRVRFQSAMDLGMFIKNNMPLNGEHLPAQDVAGVLAWLLQQHGRTPTVPISPATAGAIRR